MYFRFQQVPVEGIRHEHSVPRVYTAAVLLQKTGRTELREFRRLCNDFLSRVGCDRREFEEHRRHAETHANVARRRDTGAPNRAYYMLRLSGEYQSGEKFR